MLNICRVHICNLFAIIGHRSCLFICPCLFVCSFDCAMFVCICHRHNSSCGTMWSLDRMIWIYSQRTIGHIAGMCATLVPNHNPHPSLCPYPHRHPHIVAAPPCLGWWRWEINIIEKRFRACALLSLYLFIRSVNFCCSEFLLTELIISPHKFFRCHFFTPILKGGCWQEMENDFILYSEFGISDLQISSIIALFS